MSTSPQRHQSRIGEATILRTASRAATTWQRARRDGSGGGYAEGVPTTGQVPTQPRNSQQPKGYPVTTVFLHTFGGGGVWAARAARGLGWRRQWRRRRAVLSRRTQVVDSCGRCTVRGAATAWQSRPSCSQDIVQASNTYSCTETRSRQPTAVALVRGRAGPTLRSAVLIPGSGAHPELPPREGETCKNSAQDVPTGRCESKNFFRP